MLYPITNEETFIDIFGDTLTVNLENGYFFFRIHQKEDVSILAEAAFTRSQMHEIHARIGRLLAGAVFTESGKRLDLPGGTGPEHPSDD